MAVVAINAPEVIAALERVVIRVAAADQVVQEEGAVIVADLAKRFAPKLTGFLKASVDEHGGKVVADAPYAGYQEYGSRHNAAQPFMRPAKQFGEPLVRQSAERIYTVATR